MRETWPDTSANHLLAAIPLQANRRLMSGLQPVELTYGQILNEPEGRIEYVYFPINCLVSLLTSVDKKRSLEVGMVGNEGMVGMPMVMGIGISAVRALVQGSGTAMRMTAAHFHTEFKNDIPLQEALFRYNHLLMVQISQTAACNRFHNTDARLARRLLMSSDCLHSDKILMTQEFLSRMLGVRRVGVNKAASDLQRKHLIEYNRGNITILNRKGLEAKACTCYYVFKALQTEARIYTGVAKKGDRRNFKE